MSRVDYLLIAGLALTQVGLCVALACFARSALHILRAQHTMLATLFELERHNARRARAQAAEQAKRVNGPQPAKHQRVTNQRVSPD